MTISPALQQRTRRHDGGRGVFTPTQEAEHGQAKRNQNCIYGEMSGLRRAHAGARGIVRHLPSPQIRGGGCTETESTRRCVRPRGRLWQLIQTFRGASRGVRQRVLGFLNDGGLSVACGAVTHGQQSPRARPAAHFDIGSRLLVGMASGLGGPADRRQGATTSGQARPAIRRRKLHSLLKGQPTSVFDSRASLLLRPLRCGESGHSPGIGYEAKEAIAVGPATSLAKLCAELVAGVPCSSIGRAGQAGQLLGAIRDRNPPRHLKDNEQ
jgi:hypothetical protein